MNSRGLQPPENGLTEIQGAPGKTFRSALVWAPGCARYKIGGSSWSASSNLEALASDVLWTSATIICAY